MKNTLLGSAGSCEELKKVIAEYWCCEKEVIELDGKGSILKKGVIIDFCVWRKLKGRYRFEALL